MPPRPSSHSKLVVAPRPSTCWRTARPRPAVWPGSRRQSTSTSQRCGITLRAVVRRRSSSARASARAAARAARRRPGRSRGRARAPRPPSSSRPGDDLDHRRRSPAQAAAPAGRRRAARSAARALTSALSAIPGTEAWPARPCTSSAERRAHLLGARAEVEDAAEELDLARRRPRSTRSRCGPPPDGARRATPGRRPSPTSSSAHAAKTRSPAGSKPSRASEAIATASAATWPFMSSAPRPQTSVPRTSPDQGSTSHSAASAPTVSVCESSSRLRPAAAGPAGGRRGSPARASSRRARSRRRARRGSRAGARRPASRCPAG